MKREGESLEMSPEEVMYRLGRIEARLEELETWLTCLCEDMEDDATDDIA
jgi:hypothetical protein